MIKKTFIVLVCALVIFLGIDGCKSKRSVVSGSVIDKTFTPAHYHTYTTTETHNGVTVIHVHNDYIPDRWDIDVSSQLLEDNVEVSQTRFNKIQLNDKINYVRYSGYFTGVKWYSYVVDLED